MKAEKREARKDRRAAKKPSKRGEAGAKLTFLRVSPRKVRLVADLVRGKGAQEAISILNACPRRSAEPIAKLLRSAVANAEESKELDLDILFVKQIIVDEGPTLRRFRPRAMGRASRINKRTSHVRLVLAQA